ncbi:MAG: ferredoxin [Myxococcota bacterium]
MGYVVKIDKKSCQSSGHCVEADPRAFRWDGDDLGEVLPAAAGLERDRLISIANRCPALAISITDEDGREIEIGA